LTTEEQRLSGGKEKGSMSEEKMPTFKVTVTPLVCSSSSSSVAAKNPCLLQQHQQRE
jgi:hypothetical protein